jgi:hypothetical protein
VTRLFGNLIPESSAQVIQHHNFMPQIQAMPRHMRANKSGASCNKRSCHKKLSVKLYETDELCSVQ